LFLPLFVLDFLFRSDDDDDDDDDDDESSSLEPPPPLLDAPRTSSSSSSSLDDDDDDDVQDDESDPSSSSNIAVFFFPPPRVIDPFGRRRALALFPNRRGPARLGPARFGSIDDEETDRYFSPFTIDGRTLKTARWSIDRSIAGADHITMCKQCACYPNSSAWRLDGSNVASSTTTATETRVDGRTNERKKGGTVTLARELDARAGGRTDEAACRSCVLRACFFQRNVLLISTRLIVATWGASDRRLA